MTLFGFYVKTKFANPSRDPCYAVCTKGLSVIRTLAIHASALADIILYAE